MGVEKYEVLEKVQNSLRDMTYGEMLDRLQGVHEFMKVTLYTAAQDLLIENSRIRKMKPSTQRNELIAAKIIAWEWFGLKRSYLGMEARISLADVCQALHLDPQFVRACACNACITLYEEDGKTVRKIIKASPPVYRMPAGYRRLFYTEERSASFWQKDASNGTTAAAVFEATRATVVVAAVDAEAAVVEAEKAAVPVRPQPKLLPAPVVIDAATAGKLEPHEEAGVRLVDDIELIAHGLDAIGEGGSGVLGE